ncbi:MAG: hypothetical protein R8P61_03795 [Bacteroidia bacterium]|nr:hypothetical protein [Bacteroidia bacterium]
MLKRILTYLIFAAALSIVPQKIQAQTVLLNYFNLKVDGAQILLEWELQSEIGVKEFRVFRRFNDEPSLAHLVTMPVKGLMKYNYLDDDMFKTQGRVVHYELHIVTDKKTFKFFASQSHNPTSIQRTWGSIKSMFR